MAKPPRVASRRTRIGRGGSAVRIEGDAFLLHASVFVCGCGSLGWTVLQVALYGDEEPALVVVPLMYIAVVSFAIAYERFVLHRSPFKVLVHAHLVAVSVLPALLEMESGGFERSGGVLGWAAVAPFTAMVVLQNKQTQVRYAALFIAVVVTTVGYEQAMRTTDQPCRALFRTHYHVVQVWTWQVHMYCVATLLGVTANGLILLRMLTEKSENAIHAHKTLACSIMPPPVAREVFEQQWHRLREGKRVAAKTGGARSYGAYSDTSDSKRLGGDTQRGSGTWARRLLTPVLRAVMGEGSHSSGWSGGARVSRSSSSVASFSPPRSREHSLRSSLSLGLGDGVVGSVSSLSGVSPTNALDAYALRELRLSAHTGSRRVDRHSGVKARRHADVTVIFVDIVGFSDMCKHVKPIGVLRFLEHYFALVDTVGEEHGVTKIRTVGDGYLAVSGLMADMGVKQDAHRHVLRALTFGLGVLQEIQDTGFRLPDGTPLQVRVGLAHGPVFSGVVGRTCMQYDIFGDVPNLAARMEQTSPVGGVHMPMSSFTKMKQDLGEELAAAFATLRFQTHTGVAIKNMGSVDTVSMTWRGNEEAVERVLAGSIGDDANRTVAAHIGVLAEQFRRASWGERVAGNSDEEDDSDQADDATDVDEPVDMAEMEGLSSVTEENTVEAHKNHAETNETPTEVVEDAAPAKT